MSLASNYATVLRDGTDPKKVISYMIHKGHRSLLPQVLTILERGEDAGDTVTVAHDKDAHKIKSRFPGAKIVIDPSVVGGYLAKTGSTIVDATYRKALVTIYKNAVNN